MGFYQEVIALVKRYLNKSSNTFNGLGHGPRLLTPETLVYFLSIFPPNVVDCGLTWLNFETRGKARKSL